MSSPTPSPDRAARDLAERFRLVRSLQSPYGWGAVRIGVVIAATPAAVWAVSSGLGFHEGLTYFLGLLAVYSALLAAGVMLSGAGNLVWNRWRPLDPRRPWQRERRWNPDGVEIRTDGIALGTLVAALPFAVVGFVLQDSTDWTQRLTYVSFGVSGLLLLSAFLMSRSRGLHITWPSFPIRAGAPFTLRIGTLPGGTRFRSVRIALRVIQERGRFPLPRPLHAGAHQVWATSWNLEGDDVPTPGSDRELRVEPPSDVPGTQLRTTYPTYWELDVRLRGTGAYLARRVLVPVYANVADETTPGEKSTPAG